MSGVAQTPFHAYDHIELPEIKPDVTRVTLHRGFCPCCGRPFRAEAPAGLEPGSPFGPNLRAFAIYLRFVHAISFEIDPMVRCLFGVFAPWASEIGLHPRTRGGKTDMRSG